MSDLIEELLTKAYSATHKLLKDQELGSVVRHGLSISYGPPIPEPDLLLLTFQGGGGCPVVQKNWPRRLLYLDDDFKFGTTLRRLCRDTGLSASLESSAMAFPAVFPQARSSEAGRWTKKTGPHSVWRRHSVYWGKAAGRCDQAKGGHRFRDKCLESIRYSLGEDRVHPFTAPSNIWAVHVSGVSHHLLSSPVSGLPHVRGPEVFSARQKTYLGSQIV